MEEKYLDGVDYAPIHRLVHICISRMQNGVDLTNRILKVRIMRTRILYNKYNILCRSFFGLIEESIDGPFLACDTIVPNLLLVKLR